MYTENFSRICEMKEEARNEYMSDGSAILLYEIVKRLFDYCYPMLDKIGNMLDNLDRHAFINRSRSMLEEISRVKMQIINFRRIIYLKSLLVLNMRL